MLSRRITSKFQGYCSRICTSSLLFVVLWSFFLAIVAILAAKQRIQHRLAADDKISVFSTSPKMGLFYCFNFFVSQEKTLQGLHVCTGTLFFFFNCGPNISICSSFSKHSIRTSIIFDNYKFPLQIACLTRSVY